MASDEVYVVILGYLLSSTFMTMFNVWYQRFTNGSENDISFGKEECIPVLQNLNFSSSPASDKGWDFATSLLRLFSICQNVISLQICFCQIFTSVLW